MAVVNVDHYYAEWMPSGSPDKSGRGRIILRSATRLTELFRLTNLGSEDYRNLLHMLQTEKPVFWDSEAGWLRTAHPQMHDAEPVGEQEGKEPRLRGCVMETPLNFELPEFLARANSQTVILPSAQDRMRFVLDLARENVAAGGGPFAAGVFEHDSGRLLAAGANRVVASGYSCAHAEVVALSLAQRRLGHYDLGQPDAPASELVSSAEPCLMCMGAVLWSGVRYLVCGARGEDVTAVGFDEGPKPQDWVGELRRRGIEVRSDVLRDQACELLRAYQAAGGPIYNASR
jgi:tRNA(Arg) A34 adenosine deaminase TadA